MEIDDLLKLTVEELLDEFCVAYSPECGYDYGVTRWKDAHKIWEEFDLEEENCFCTDTLLPYENVCAGNEKILELDDLRDIMDTLGIIKKQQCPSCGSWNYHLDYNDLSILCNECGYRGQQDER